MSAASRRRRWRRAGSTSHRARPAKPRIVLRRTNLARSDLNQCFPLLSGVLPSGNKGVPGRLTCSDAGRSGTMQDRWQGQDRSPKGLLDRLDRAAGNMNAYLLVIAIGLAALDFTCFSLFQAQNSPASATRAGANPPASSPSAAQNNSSAAVKSAVPAAR